jgi:hypothetical protein
LIFFKKNIIYLYIDSFKSLSIRLNNFPNSDVSISVSSEKSGSQSVPGQRSTNRLFQVLGFLVSRLLDLRVGDDVGEEGVDGVEGKRNKVPDFDSGFGGGSDPLEFGVEGNLVDLGLGIKFSGGG